MPVAIWALIDSSRPRRGKYPWVAADTMISIRPRFCSLERREHALTIGVDEVGLRPPVEIGPGRSAATTALVARLFELRTVRFRAVPPLLQVGQQSGAEPGRGTHLGEDGRKANGDRSLAPFLL